MPFREEDIEEETLTRASGIQSAAGLGTVERADSETAALINLENSTEIEYKNSVGVDAFKSGNIATGAYHYMDRQLNIEDDKDFNMEDHRQELRKDIPSWMWGELEGAGSLEEANAIKDQLKGEIQAQMHVGGAGAAGIGAMLVAGIIDVDLPLMFLSGGGSIATKLGLGGTRLAKWMKRAEDARLAGRTLQGRVGRGALAGAAIAAADVAVHPAASLTALPGMIMMGAGISGVAGKKVNKSLELAQEQYAASLAKGTTRGEVDTRMVGAVFDGPKEDFSERASTFLTGHKETRSKGIGGRVADAFGRLLAKTPLLTDHDLLLNSKSPTMRAIGVAFFESASGRVRNNRTAANLDESYTKRIGSPVLTSHPGLFNDWARARGGKTMDRHWDTAMRDEWNRDLALEMNSRRLYEGRSVDDVDPNIKRAADAEELGGAEARDILKGRGNEKSVDGAENFEKTSGYRPLQWKSRGVISSLARFGETRVLALINKAYKSAMPGLDDVTIEIISKAILRRARGLEKDMDMSLINMIGTADGRAFLKEALLDSRVPPDRVDRIIEGLSGKMSEKGKAGFTKHRSEIDLSMSDGELSMLDMVETDSIVLWSRYSRQASGQAAMARQGITNRAKLNELMDVALEEDRLAGGNISRDKLDDMFTYFGGGPIAGGVTPTLRRLIQTTNLSLLPQLGLTQLAETGVQMAAVGVGNFIKQSAIVGRIAMNAKKGAKDPLLEDLRPWLGEIGGDHQLYRDDLAMDFARVDRHHQTHIMNTVDKALAKGRRLQGYLSGFNQIKSAQQRIAVRGMADKVGQAMRDGAGSSRRVEDIGLNTETIARMKKKYVDSGVVEFNKDGSLNQFHLDKWDPVDAEDMSLALNRFSNQSVQKAMAGESTTWMHKDLGALFTHLQQFPILAMQKQFIRNMRIGDTATQMMFIYGLGTASVAYMAKQAINGNTDRLSPEEIAKGAFGLSNMTGWVPLWTDPISAMLGLDPLMLNNYNRGGSSFTSPPVLGVVDRLLQTPGALATALTGGELTSSDVNALKAIPVAGNAYIMGGLLNSLKPE